jgi:4-hydroxy-2-oxoheptanedioate aldolase
MARHNRVIQRLIDGETVFSTLPTPNGNYETLATLSRSAFDMVMIETEHEGFDFSSLRNSLQYMQNRKRIIEQGSWVDPAPFVRIPANTREQNQWIIKQTLDAGAMGLILPHLDSVEGAEAAVRAARYPQARGSAKMEPAGQRGWGLSAPHYWGLTPTEYYDCADIWPIDPNGEILLMGIVENVNGVRALPEILKRVKGIGAIWAGRGDLSISMGLRGDGVHPDVEKELLHILDIAKEHGVPCAAVASRPADIESRIEQGFQIILLPTPLSFDLLNSGLKKVGR